MNLAIIVLFGVTLMYISIAERFATYLKLVALQGVLLFLLVLTLSLTCIGYSAS